MQLDELLQRHEGKTLEFKRDLSSLGPIVKSVVAFANTSGGDLVVGVDDGTREVVGLDDPLGDSERLANVIADRISPTVLPDVDVVAWRSTNVLIARIADSPLRPHFVRHEGREQGVYVRIGSTTRRADVDMVAELARYAQNRSLDEEPRPELDSEAIDFSAAAESFAAIRTLERSDLRTLRMLIDYQGALVPTVGGLLLFGKDRLDSFPDAWIRVGAFSGVDRSMVIDSKDVTSYLPGAIEEAVTHVERTTSTGLEISGGPHVPRPTYPIVAIREAITNAVLHADYSQRGAPITVSLFRDRIEIENPGILPFGLTLDEALSGTSKLRNHVIGHVFGKLRLIEQWGSGIPRMLIACRDAGLADPIFQEHGTRFRVTIMSGSVGETRVDAVDSAILAHLRSSQEDGGLATSQVARAIGRSERSTRSRLWKLVDRGLAQRIAMSRTDPKARWVPTHSVPIGTATETDTAVPIRAGKRKGDWLIVNEWATEDPSDVTRDVSIGIRNVRGTRARISRVEVIDPTGTSRAVDFSRKGPGSPMAVDSAVALYPSDFAPDSPSMVDGTYDVRWFVLTDDGPQVELLAAKFGLHDGSLAA